MDPREADIETQERHAVSVEEIGEQLRSTLNREARITDALAVALSALRDIAHGTEGGHDVREFARERIRITERVCVGEISKDRVAIEDGEEVE